MTRDEKRYSAIVSVLRRNPNGLRLYEIQRAVGCSHDSARSAIDNLTYEIPLAESDSGMLFLVGEE